MEKTVIVLSRNHFDNTWRRCWDRPYVYHGKSYASYVAVERAVLDNAAALEIEPWKILTLLVKR